MPSLLKNLELEELSLVDKPANPLAMAPLFKRDNSNGDPMPQEIKKTEEAEVVAPVEIDTTEVDTLKAEIETLKASNEELRKSFLDEGYKITTEGVVKMAPVEYLEIEGEKINKAEIPAPILKRLEEAEVEKAENIITKRCQETLPNVAEANARILLKALDGLDEDAAKSFAEFLKSTDSLIEGLTEEVGKSAAQGDMQDPNDQLNALAKAHAAENEISFAKAYAAVVKTDEGKALTKAIYKKD
jgi:hypothetical protein